MPKALTVQSDMHTYTYIHTYIHTYREREGERTGKLERERERTRKLERERERVCISAHQRRTTKLITNFCLVFVIISDSWKSVRSKQLKGTDVVQRERERERERERQRQRQRQTERQRQTDRQTDRETETEGNKRFAVVVVVVLALPRSTKPQIVRSNDSVKGLPYGVDKAKSMNSQIVRISWSKTEHVRHTFPPVSVHAVLQVV